MSKPLTSKQLVSNKFGQVSEIALSADMQALVIDHKLCQAKISLYGGQVLSWQPQGQQEVFWLSKSSTYQQGSAIRGGIPLCWPWFGAHYNDPENNVGNHGFARQQTWQVNCVDIKELGVEISLIWQGKGMHALWPNACKLKQILFFGTEFKQQFEMTNLSERDAQYTGALHSYFYVSSPENVRINNLSNVEFDDKLTGQRSSAELFCNGVGLIDRIYYTNQIMHIEDKHWQRTIEVISENTQQWVFWNPGKELATNMPDIHLNGEQAFVCLEAANTQVQTLPAGANRTIGQVIRVIANDV